MKTHLQRIELPQGAACDKNNSTLESTYISTYIWQNVDCERCKTTDEYKKLEARYKQLMHEDIMSIKDEVLKKSCQNCYYCENEKCTNSRNLTGNPINMLDDAHCSQWRYKVMSGPGESPKTPDPAIDLLSRIAELIKDSGLSTDEKLKVIDFIESRVRQVRL
jgi:hypothetical protein